MTPQETWQAIRDEVERLKPEILPEYDALYNDQPYKTAILLDVHFPIDGSWGTVLIQETPAILKEWTPQ